MRSFLYTLNIHVACMLVYNIIKQLKGVLQMFNGYQQMPMYNNNIQQQLSQQAQSANIINQLRPTPIPAYVTCSPYESSMYANGRYNTCGC